MFDRYVAFAARLHPQTIAVSSGSSHVSYKDLDRLISQIAIGLDQEGATNYRLLLVAISDPYHHLLVLLACARLGIATVSASVASTRIAAEVTEADGVLSDYSEVRPSILINTEWLTGALSLPTRRIDTSAELDALGRVQLTSGTTGQPKAVGLSWRLLDRRIEHTWMSHSGYERLLSLVGLESGSLPLLIWCLARGGCLLFGSREVGKLASSLPALSPTGILLSPAQLDELLEALPPDSTPFQNAHVGVIGAMASRQLCQRAALRLGTVNVSYASTEAGVCTLGVTGHRIGPDSVGWVTPWTTLEIVDEVDKPLPHDQIGKVRISGSDVANGYFPRSESDGHFRDGWFYPGDLGSLSLEGALRVVGREDDLMNLGGEKYLPAAFEEPVQKALALANVAAFALEGRNGVTMPWIAVVKERDVTQEDISTALKRAHLPTAKVLWVEEIPKTAVGKVRRKALKEAAQRLETPNQ